MLIISLYATMKTNQRKSYEEKIIQTTIAYESTITNSLTFLYNDNINITISNEYIDSKNFNNIKNNFIKSNEKLKESGMYLSNIKLNKEKIYSRRIEGEKYYIYFGNLDLEWSFLESKSEGSKESRKVIAYFTKDNDKYSLFNIDFESVN